MSGVSVDRLVILIAVVLVAAGGAFGWSKSGLGRAGEHSATPAPAKFVQNADFADGARSIGFKRRR